MVGLPSDVIGCVVKLMSNDELIRVGQKVFNPLPGSKVGAKGYLGARIQPNSPTDDPDDILWQVFDGWSFAVGDVVLGTNPVSSEPRRSPASSARCRTCSKAFELEDVMPHCVLAHIDVQAEVEAEFPGTTALWFQSLRQHGDGQRDVRHHGRQDAGLRGEAHGPLRPVFRDRPGRRLHQRPRARASTW